MAWIFLFLAGVCEIAATTVYRYSDGLSRLGPTLACILFGIASFYLLNRSLAGIPLGTAYAVWTGVGAAGTAIIGILAFAEPTTTMRVICLTALVGGIIGLKLFEA